MWKVWSAFLVMKIKIVTLRVRLWKEWRLSYSKSTRIIIAVNLVSRMASPWHHAEFGAWAQDWLPFVKPCAFRVSPFKKLGGGRGLVWFEILSLTLLNPTPNKYFSWLVTKIASLVDKKQRKFIYHDSMCGNFS